MKRMDVRQLDLNLLRVFAQLLRERQVSRAAVALGLSQPAVSNALRRLREELGDELFHRSARGMQPTAYALRIAPAVTQALDLIGGALATAQDFDPVDSQRSFTLAMSDVGQIYFLPLLMETLACEAPQVSLRIVGLNAAELPLAMSDGRIDVALGWLPQLQAGFFQQVLFRQGYVCLMRAGHPAAARPGVAPAFVPASTCTWKPAARGTAASRHNCSAWGCSGAFASPCPTTWRWAMCCCTPTWSPPCPNALPNASAPRWRWSGGRCPCACPIP